MSSATTPGTIPAGVRPERDGILVTRCRWARLGAEVAHDGALPPAVPLAPAAVGTLEDPVVFPQRPGGLDWLLGPGASDVPQDADAFQASIYAPARPPAGGAPVVVFLPGGGYVSGGASVRWHDASVLARAARAVVIVPAYRLGAAACFTPGPDGTVATVADAIAAVVWAIDHAARFGGNPHDVTLAGQSAGAWLAFAAAQDPALAGRVKRLALYSLPYQPPPGPLGSDERRRFLAESLAGAAPSRAEGDALLAASAELNRAWAGRGLGVQPLAGGRLPADVNDWRAAAERLAGVREVLLSTTAHEAHAFLPPGAADGFPGPVADGFRAAHFARPAERPAGGAWERMTVDLTEYQFASAARELARELRATGAAVHLSRLDVDAAIDGVGAAHCLDVPFLFGDRSRWLDAPMLEGLPDSVFDAVAAAWREPLVRALAGDPVTTAAGEVRAVGLADGVVRVAEMADPAIGAPIRRAEP